MCLAFATILWRFLALPETPICANTSYSVSYVHFRFLAFLCFQDPMNIQIYLYSRYRIHVHVPLYRLFVCREERGGREARLLTYIVCNRHSQKMTIFVVPLCSRSIKESSVSRARPIDYVYSLLQAGQMPIEHSVA